MKNSCLYNVNPANATRSCFASSVSSSTDSAVSSGSSISQASESSHTEDSLLSHQSPEFREIEQQELAGLLKTDLCTNHACSDNPSKLLILDCRNFADYNHCHIAGSVNILYARMQRKRLVDNKLCCASLLNQHLKTSNITRTFDSFENCDVVLYAGDEKTRNFSILKCNKLLSQKENVAEVPDDCSSSERCIELFFNKLKSGSTSLHCKRVMLLKGSFLEFRNNFPELCETNEQQQQQLQTPSVETAPVFNGHPSPMNCHTGPSNTGHNHHHQNLQNNNPSTCSFSSNPTDTSSNSTGTSSNAMTLVLNQPLQRLSLPNSFSQPCLSSAPVFANFDRNADEEPSSGPTQILDFMFLGSQQDALDPEVLQKNGITKIINLSENCPRPDSIVDKNSHFFRIPIKDSYSAKLLPHFDAAHDFLESAKKNNEKVLVHCLAGISRSATLAIAYIMRSKRMPSDEAYKFVKKLRPSISPNFNFMGQLLEYEKQLRERQILSPANRPHSYAAASSNNRYDPEGQLPSTSSSENLDLNFNDRVCKSVSSDHVLSLGLKKDSPYVNENGKRTMDHPLSFPERPKQLMKTGDNFFQKRPGSIPLTPTRARPTEGELPSPSTEFANLDISNPIFAAHLPPVSPTEPSSGASMGLSFENPMFNLAKKDEQKLEKKSSHFMPSKMLQTHCSRSLMRYLKNKKQKLTASTGAGPSSSASNSNQQPGIVPCSSRCVISSCDKPTSATNKCTSGFNRRFRRNLLTSNLANSNLQTVLDMPDAELTASLSTPSNSPKLAHRSGAMTAPVEALSPSFLNKRRAQTVPNGMEIDEFKSSDPYRDPERDSIGSASEIAVN